MLAITFAVLSATIQSADMHEKSPYVADHHDDHPIVCLLTLYIHGYEGAVDELSTHFLTPVACINGNNRT